MGSRPDFTVDEKDRALLVLALNGENAVRAQKQLKNEGLKLTVRSLNNWRHLPRYTEIREKHAAKIEQSLISRYRTQAERSLDLAAAATEQALVEAKDGTLKDSGGTAKNAMLASGIAVDKSLLIEGRPTTIVGNDDIDIVMKRLARQMGFAAIDGTATEMPLIPESAIDNAREAPELEQHPSAT